MRDWNYEPRKTQAEVIREHGYEGLDRLGGGQLKTIDPKTRAVVMKDYTTYMATVGEATVRIMVVEKINDVVILSNMMVNYHIIINEKDWMLLQSKKEL